ncbi:MAG: hypothetical protein ABJE10_11745, partial [bacterium]
RRRLIARIDNPAAPLGERLESLRMLPQTSCTNVRDLMFGPPADVVNAIARAERTIPRYPSERALIELQARVPSLANTDPAHASFWSPALSAASVAGTVLHNPRLAECTVMLSSMGGW